MFTAILDFIANIFGFVLRYVYLLVGSYGLAIILFTLLTKVLMFPFTLKGKRSTFEMQKLQPKIRELEKKYKNDKRKYQEETAKLYEKEGVSPLGGCGPQLITLPVMFALYYVVQRPLSYMMGFTAQEISNIAARMGLDVTGQFLNTIEINIASQASAFADKLSGFSDKLIAMDFNFLGINLAAQPNFNFGSPDFSIGLFLLPFISAATSLLFSHFSMKWQAKAGLMAVQQQQGSTKMMMYMAPLMSVWIGFAVPAGLALYWIASNFFMLLQEKLLCDHFAKKIEERRAKEEIEKAKRKKKKAQIEDKARLEGTESAGEVNIDKIDRDDSADN